MGGHGAHLEGWMLPSSWVWGWKGACPPTRAFVLLRLIQDLTAAKVLLLCSLEKEGREREWEAFVAILSPSDPGLGGGPLFSHRVGQEVGAA